MLSTVCKSGQRSRYSDSLMSGQPRVWILTHKTFSSLKIVHTDSSAPPARYSKSTAVLYQG